MEGTIADLKEGFEEQRRECTEQRRLAREADERCLQIRDLLERAAPEELQKLPDHWPAPLPPGPEQELFAERKKNREMQARLEEERKRRFEEANWLMDATA